MGGMYSTKLEQFEHEFAEYCEVKHAIGVGNGSDALYLILAALKVKSGDEVIAPNSFVASAATIALRALLCFWWCRYES